MTSNSVWTAAGANSLATKVPTKKDFTRREWDLIQKVRTPEQVQEFLRTIPYNRELDGQTCYSFRRALRENTAHCLEGALIAATIMEQHGYPPVLLSIESQDKLDHVLLIFKRKGRLGSVARSRDLGLHGRKPVFRTVRDLVMSYFEQYIDSTGRITGYGTASLYELGRYDWRFSPRNVFKVERHLQDMPHRQIHSSDTRYERAKRRYIEFHSRHPDRYPDYFANSNLWLS